MRTHKDMTGDEFRRFMLRVSAARRLAKMKVRKRFAEESFVEATSGNLTFLLSKSTYPGIPFRVTRFATEDGELVPVGHSDARTLEDAIDAMLAYVEPKDLL
jgi:hypothetical protein